MSADSRPFLSPDGKRVAFLSDRWGTLQLFEAELDEERLVASGARQVTFHTEGLYPWGYTPDGADMIALAGDHPGFRLIHSAGKSGYDTVAKKLQETCPFDLAAAGYDVRPYIYDMPLVMAAADLVLCRAGASTLAELTYLGKPAILVPSPYVTNNHQEKNARVLEHAGGAKVLLEPELKGEDLLTAIRALLSDPSALDGMAKAMKSCGVPDATERIADIVLEMVRVYQ